MSLEYTFTGRGRDRETNKKLLKKADDSDPGKGSNSGRGKKLNYSRYILMMELTVSFDVLAIVCE